MASDEMKLLLEERREAIKLLRGVLYATADPTLEIPDELLDSLKDGWAFIRVIDQRWIDAMEEMKDEQRRPSGTPPEEGAGPM